MKPHLVFQNAAFSRLAALQLIISLADWMLIVLLQIIVFDLTHSAFNVMLLIICELVPMLLFGALAGALTDRANLKQVLGWACLLRLVVIAALLVPFFRQQLIPLFLVTALSATCNRFFVPAASALLPRLVPAEKLSAANALIMSVRMAGMAAGTLIAGVVASHYGHTAAVSAIAVLLLIAGVLCLAIPGLRSQPPQAHEGSLWGDLRLTITRYGASLMLPLAASMLVMLALGSFEILALIYVSRILHRPSSDVSLLFGCYGFGMLAGLVLSSMKNSLPRYNRWMLISLVLMCVSIWALSQAKTMAWALPMVAIAGLAEGLVITLSLLRIYTQVPDEFCARVIALLDTGTGAAYLVSVLLTGFLADRYAADVLLHGIALTLSALLALGFILTQTGNTRRSHKHLSKQ